MSVACGLNLAGTRVCANFGAALVCFRPTIARRATAACTTITGTPLTAVVRQWDVGIATSAWQIVCAQKGLVRDIRLAFAVYVKRASQIYTT